MLKSLFFVCILVFVFKFTDKLFHPSNLFIFSSFACLFSFLHFSTFLLFIFYVFVSFKPFSYSLSNKLFGLFIFYSLNKFYFYIYSLHDHERIMDESCRKKKGLWMNEWMIGYIWRDERELETLVLLCIQWSVSGV